MITTTGGARRLAVGVLAALTLTACSGSTASDDASGGPSLPSTDSAADQVDSAEAEASASSAAPTSEGPAVNERGNIVMAMGQEGALSTSSGAPMLTFAVDAITPDVDCTEQFASPPENGHMVKVDMRVATESGQEAAQQLSYTSITGFDWSFIGSDGLTFTDVAGISTYSCLDSAEMLSSELRPGSQYAGALIFDLPESSGALIYTPTSVFDGTGFEWHF